MKTAISILLSITVLFGSLGVTIATHYCYDEAVKTSVLLSLETFGCGMSETSEAFYPPADGSPALTQGSCCENKFQVADLDDDFKPQAAVTLFDLNFLIAVVATSANLSTSPDIHRSHRTLHPPPLIETDRQILFQTFLI